MMINKFFRRLLSGILALTLVLALLPAQLSVAETNPPTSSPQDAPNELSTTSTGIFGGIYISANGFIEKPSNLVVISKGEDQSPMTVPLSLKVTNLKGTPTRLPQKVNEVAFKRYDGNSQTWPSSFLVVNPPPEMNDEEPSKLLDTSVPVPTTAGDYYFQLRLQFNHAGAHDRNPEKVYSKVFRITVLPPEATQLMVTPDRQTVLWGQPATLFAKTEPLGSKPSVNWAGPDESLGKLLQTTPTQTRFVPTTLSDPTSPFALFDNGYDLRVIAKSLGTDNHPAGFTASAVVNVGGANPLTVKYGQTIDFKSPVSTDNFPDTPTYKWVIYDEQREVYKPTPEEDVDASKETFHWGKVYANRAKKMYYQLQVSFKLANGQETTWYSNLAPITITDQPERPNLVAVPNLHFFLDGNGQETASITDFQRPGGARLFYGNAIVSPGEAFDGNSRGELEVASVASHWSLSVSFSQFQNMATGETLSNHGEFELSLADGTRAQVKDDDNSVTLYDNQTGPRETKLTKNTTLSFPAMRDVKPGTYQSTATWTLVQAAP